MLERKIGKADPPAAARTMTAQIVHLKQLHAKRQQLQIGGQLTGIFNIVHNGAAKLNACCNAFDLPRISLAGLTVNGVFRLYFRQTNACKIAGIGYKAVSELKPGTFDRRSGTEKPQNGGVVILVVGHMLNILAFAANKPLVGVHHIEGHISANYIENPDLEPPFTCLVVSGGHTNLVLVEDYGVYKIIGRTRDDAAGEAFDKVARAVGLGYPGGPKVDKLAKEGNKDAIVFPRAKVDGSPYDFSFSGIKSAVLNYINHCEMKNEEINRADLVASFQNAVVDALVSRAVMAAKENGYKKLAVAGGVASNSALRAAREEECRKNNIRIYHPSPIFCTDNAAMIGAAGYYEYMAGSRAGWDLNAVPNLKLGEKSLRGRIV